MTDSSNLVVRPIQAHDLDGLLQLAGQTGGGMTTLKADRLQLGERVATACASFAEQLPPPQRDYLFVMEDTGTAELVGVAAIKSAVGLDQPFYNYRMGALVHASAELGVFSTMETLYLSNDLMGSAELCSLFLHPAYRNGYNGKLLSKSRLLFLAQFASLFPPRLIAELRGFLREDGSSPFWDHLGQHFFKMDFNRADELSSLGKKSFIAELMPRYPLYVACLPVEAQQVIGVVHDATAPARRMLESEGLHYEGYLDIFDAGPVLQARIAALRAVRESRLLPLTTSTTEAASTQVPLLIASTSLQDFRVICASLPKAQDIALSSAQQQLLRCESGDQLRVLPLNPRRHPNA